MDKDKEKSIKKAVKYQELEIRKFVAELDPIGIGGGFPVDEYDDLIYNIISILNRKNYNLNEKKELLIDRILEYGYLPIMYTKVISETVDIILQWWQNQTPNT